MPDVRPQRISGHSPYEPVFGFSRPAATAVIVAGLLDPAWLVEIEAEAVLP
jgi:enamine deaminase RidA (YjgF/YER057c/UK114 family)